MNHTVKTQSSTLDEASFGPLAMEPAFALPSLTDEPELLRAIFAVGYELVLARDPVSHRVIFSSQALAVRWHTDQHGDLIHADDAPRAQDLWARLKNGDTYTFDYHAQLHHGRIVSYQERGQAARLRNGRLVVVGLVTEATEHQRLKQQLEECEAYADRLIATSPGAFFWYRHQKDGHAESRFANPKVAAAYGLKQPGVDGRHDDVFEIVHPEDRERVRQAVTASMRTLTPIKQEFRVRHLRAGDLWTELHVVPLQDTDGGVSWDGFLQDITARKQVEMSLISANALLEQRVMERTQELEQRSNDIALFNHVVSHDLRAPLRAIDAYGQLLCERCAASLDDQGKEFLQSIRHQADKMGRLIDDLLKFARMDASSRDVQRLDLQQQLGEVLELLSFEISRRAVNVVLDLQCTQVWAENTSLQLAIRNIVDNALKFGRQDGTGQITISSKRQNERCLLSIADNGNGFNPACREKIFNLFHRLQSKSNGPSTGVGLTLVRRALQRTGAKVWADATPKVGATFFIDIPAIDDR